MRKMGNVQRALADEQVQNMQSDPAAVRIPMDHIKEIVQLPADACDELVTRYETEPLAILTFNQLVDDLTLEYQTKSYQFRKAHPEHTAFVREREDRAGSLMENVAMACMDDMRSINSKVEEFDAMEARQQAAQDNAPVKKLMVGKDKIASFARELTTSADGINYLAAEKASEVLETYPDMKKHVEQITIESYYALAVAALTGYAKALESQSDMSMLFLADAQGQLHNRLDDCYKEWVDVFPHLEGMAEESKSDLDNLLNISLESGWKEVTQAHQERDGRG